MLERIAKVTAVAVLCGAVAAGVVAGVIDLVVMAEEPTRSFFMRRAAVQAGRAGIGSLLLFLPTMLWLMLYTAGARRVAFLRKDIGAAVSTLVGTVAFAFFAQIVIGTVDQAQAWSMAVSGCLVGLGVGHIYLRRELRKELGELTPLLDKLRPSKRKALEEAEHDKAAAETADLPADPSGVTPGRDKL